MTIIHLETEISAPIEICFDLARDIEIHTKSTTKTNERAIAGRTSGLCELNDEITWEATHFGIRQQLTSKITEMVRPYRFADKMTNGAFKSMHHEHIFEEKNGKTRMTDRFNYETPFGIFGKLFDRLILNNYMRKFLQTRNAILKDMAEKMK